MGFSHFCIMCPLLILPATVTPSYEYSLCILYFCSYTWQGILKMFKQGAPLAVLAKALNFSQHVFSNENLIFFSLIFFVLNMYQSQGYPSYSWLNSYPKIKPANTDITKIPWHIRGSKAFIVPSHLKVYCLLAKVRFTRAGQITSQQSFLSFTGKFQYQASKFGQCLE